MTLKKITPEKPGKDIIVEKEWYPSFRLKTKDIPEVKNWDVGKTYRMEIEVELKGISEDERESTVRFDIKKVGIIKKDIKEEYKKMIKGDK